MYFRIRSLTLLIVIGSALNGALAQVATQDDLQKPSAISGRVTIDGKAAPNIVVSLEPSIGITILACCRQAGPFYAQRSGAWDLYSVGPTRRRLIWRPRAR